MRRARRFRAVGLITLLQAVVLLCTSVAQAAPSKPGARFPTSPQPKIALSYRAPSAAAAGPKSGNPKLDSSMAETVDAAKTSKVKAVDVAKSLHLPTSGDSVQVYVTSHSGQAAAAIGAITSAGGRVTKTRGQAGLIQAWVPVDAVSKVAASPSVEKVSRPDVGFADAGAVTSEGLGASGVDAWQAVGYRGAGAKVAVVDVGFQGYTALKGTEIPGNVIVKNFVDGESDALIDGTEVHGTACAEIVYDVAPDAQLYLVKVSTSLDLQDAVTWLGSQGVDVISMSLSWFNEGPGDGTGLLSDLVSQARNSGIAWFTSAGNYRQMHWGGNYSDPDGDTYHNWTAGSTANVDVFGPGDGTWYLIPAGEPLDVFLRWDDWRGVNQDYNTMIVRWDGSTWEQVAYSHDPQTGQAGQTPTEEVAYTTSGADTYYGIVVEKVGPVVATGNDLEIFSTTAELDYQVAARSITSPSDSQYAVSVGAVTVSSPYDQEIYSSEGPTNGSGGKADYGAPKPDIAAYDRVSTATYGTTGFAGTSASTPHVAGAAALVAGARPDFSSDQVRSYLTGRAIDLGDPGRDLKYGVGRLNLGTPPPSISSFSPTSGTVGTVVSITGTRLANVTSVSFGGVAATTFTVNSPTKVTATVPADARTGPIQVYTSDGELGTSATSFKVIPRISIGGYDIPEGDSGITNVSVGVSLDVVPADTVTVSYATANGTATAGSDYQSVSGTLTFSPGQTSKVITVPVFGDTANEPDETYSVSLSNPVNAVISTGQWVGTILNDDTPILPTVSGFTPASGTVGTTVVIGGTHLSEATAVKFNGVSSTSFTVDSATQITAVVPPGASTGPISVTTPSGTSASSASFTLIVPALSIGDVSGSEGNAGTGGLTFTVSLSPASAATVTVDFMTADGTAITGSDYFGVGDSLTFAPGQTSKTVTIGVLSDTLFEPDEVFYVNLSNATNATIADGQGIGTIKNDDPPGPSIGSFSPTSGPPGTSVTIDGSSFVEPLNVYFNGTVASFTVNSATRITATVPAGATTGPISISTPHGTAASSGSFVVTSPSQPQVNLLSQPSRVVDTRNASGHLGAGQPLLGVSDPHCYPLAGNAGVPGDATAVIVNLTAVGYTKDGWIAAYPYDPARTDVPSTSSVNFDTAENAIANFAIVKVGQGGKVCLTASSRTNAIVDVSGYLVSTAGGQIGFLSSPTRFVDTRSGTGSPLQKDVSRCYQIADSGEVPKGATAAIVNLTAVGYTGDGWIAAYPSGSAFAGTSSLSFDTAENAIANFAIARLGPDGQLVLLGSTPTNTIVDVSGYLR